MPSIFMDSVASRHNLFPGSAVGGSPDLNISGIPGMKGPEGAMAMMFVEPMLKSMVGPGFIPGQFNQTHNLYDHYRRKAQFQAMQTTMSSAAEADQQQYATLLRGMAATAGVKWNDDKERAAQMMAQDMSKISPMLAQIMPDTFDRMHGSRGSATLMAQGMFSGGRYRNDPVTGMLGASADSTALMTKEIYNRLYGPGADLTDMKGLGAGRAGQMFDEMSRRGMMPRVLNRDEQMQGIAQQTMKERGPGGLADGLGKTMDELRSLSSPQLEMKIRQFEASRIGDRVKSMAGAVAAMKDVFGEMGRPDAPMTELIEGLQVITQGGLASMSPQRIESLVRDTANIARRSGMGMDNMTMLMATSAQRADAMGLDRSFGVQAGMQAAMFGSAYANNIGGMPAWGRGDKERMVAIDSQLRLNAANSSVGNQLAATVRLGKDIGFKAGSEAEALLNAVQSGETTYTFDGKTKSVHADAGRWRSLMKESGVDIGVASAYRSDTAYNQKTISEENLVGLTRQLQADVDIAPRVSRAYQRGARQAGITDNDLLAKIGDAAQAGLLGEVAPEDMQDPDKMAEYLAGKLGIDKGDAAKMAQLKLVATRGWSTGEQMVKTSSRLRGYKTFDQAITANRRGTNKEAILQLEEAQQESRLQSAMSGLGSGGPLERIIDAVSSATNKTEVKDIIAKTLGWNPEGEVGQRLEKTVQAMNEEMKKFRDTDADKVGRDARAAAAAGDDLKVRALADQYTGGNVDVLLNSKNLKKTIRESALAKIRGMSPELRRQAEAAGLEIGASATSGDAAKAWGSLRDKRGGAGVLETDLLAEKLLHDDRSMSILGGDGLSLIQRLQSRNQETRALANKFAGGDIGNLMATDAQRSLAKEAYAEVTKSSAESKRLEAEYRAAEDRGDIAGMDAKRAELEAVNKKVTAAQGRLDSVGRELGTTGEVLARSGPVDAAARTKAEGLRRDQMTDTLAVQEKLRGGKRTDLTPEQKKQLEAERVMRRKADPLVMDEIFKSLGLDKDVSAADRAAIGSEALKGDRGVAIRAAVPALQRLRELKKDLSAEQFRDYLRNGMGAGASDEEKSLYHKVAAGKTGGGLAGLGVDRAGIAEKLRDFAPDQRDAVTGKAVSRAGGGGGDLTVSGNLTVNLETGTGRLNAKGTRS